MSNPMLAYSYIRVSGESQVKGQGLGRQLKATKEFCKAHGYQLNEEEFTDKGYSGFKGDNLKYGELGLLLKKLKDGEIPKGCYLIVENLDRISRLPIREASRIIDDINKYMHIVTVNPEKVYPMYDPTKKEDNDTYFMQLIEIIITLKRANEESERKSYRSAKNWAEKRKIASLEKKPITKKCPEWLEVVTITDLVTKKQTQVFKIIPGRDTAIKRIFQLYHDGVGVGSIARILNEEGIKPFKFGKTIKKGNLELTHRKWSNGSVGKLLHNDAVTGLGRFKTISDDKHHTNVIENYYPQIIDQITFESVKSIADSRRTNAVKGGGRVNKDITNLFKGLLFSIKDGSQMYVIGRKDKNLFPIILGTEKELINGKMKKISFPYHAFEKLFLMLFHSIDPALLNEKPTNITEQTKQLDALRANLAVNTKRYEIIKENLDGAGEGDFSKMIKQQMDYLKNVENLKKEIKLLEASMLLENNPTTKFLSLLDFLFQKEKEMTVDEYRILRAKIRLAISQKIKKIEIGIALDPNDKTEKGRTIGCLIYFMEGGFQKFFVIRKVIYKKGINNNYYSVYHAAISTVTSDPNKLDLVLGCDLDESHDPNWLTDLVTDPEDKDTISYQLGMVPYKLDKDGEFIDFIEPDEMVKLTIANR